jgi:hypothetical protein
LSRLKNWQSKEEILNLKWKKKENDGEIIKKKSIEKMIPKKNSNQNKVG